MPDAVHAKQLWPVLGRPGAVLVDGELVGAWRPRKSGKKFTVAVQPWGKMPPATRKAITEQAEHLAAYRGIALDRRRLHHLATTAPRLTLPRPHSPRPHSPRPAKVIAISGKLCDQLWPRPRFP